MGIKSNQALAARQEAKGLCAWGACPQGRAKDRTLCRGHLKKLRAYSAKRRFDCLAAGLCVDCGKPSELKQARCLAHRKYKGGGAIGNLPMPVYQALKASRDLEAQTERDKTARTAREFIDRHLHLLDARTQKMLTMRYGHTERECQTLEQVGEHFGLTRERVRQIQEIAEERILMFTIEKDIPIPDGKGNATEIRKLLASMEAGDSFVCPSNSCNKMPDVAKAMNYVIVTRKISDTERRVWLVSKTREPELAAKV